jgi:hypothetical protein
MSSTPPCWLVDITAGVRESKNDFGIPESAERRTVTQTRSASEAIVYGVPHRRIGLVSWVFSPVLRGPSLYAPSRVAPDPEGTNGPCPTCQAVAAF